MACIACAFANKLSSYKQSKLIEDAKKMAIENKKYYSIVFDEDDEDFEIIEHEEVKQRGLTAFVYDTLSPYQTITT